MNIQLTRSIILNTQHAAAGTTHDLPDTLAQDLINAGAAIQVSSLQSQVSNLTPALDPVKKVKKVK